MTTASIAETSATLRAEPRLGLSVLSRIILLAYGVSMLLVGLGSRVLTRHEVLAAYPAKEMLQYGHWIVQMFAGIPRTAKPPTTGWFIAASMALFQSDAEWVARLPAVIAGVLTALMIASLAARFYGNRVGLVAGLIQLTCCYVPLQARLAEADMLVCAAMTGAMMCLAWGTLPELRSSSRLSRLLPIGFYLLAGLSFMLKAVPVVFIALSCLCYLAVRRDRHTLRFLLHPLGIPILLISIIAWPVAAYLTYPGIIESWKFELFGTFGGQLGKDPIYAYLLSIPAMLLPWVPLMAVPVGLAFLDAWRKLPEGQSPAVRLGQAIRGVFAGHPLRQLLLCWFLPGLIFLHFSAAKHKHYPIPMLPPLSILGAVGLLWHIERQHRNLKARRGLVAMLYSAGCLIAMAIIYRFDLVTTWLGHLMPRKAGQLAIAAERIQPIAPYAVAVIAAAAVGVLIVIYMEHRRHMAGQLAAAFATAWLVIAGIGGWIVPAVDDYRPQADLARQASSLVPPGQMILIIDPLPQVEPHAAYYLRPPIWRYRDEKSFAEYARGALASDSKPIYVIATPNQVQSLLEVGNVEIMARCQGRWSKRPEQFSLLARVTRPGGDVR